MPPLNFLQHYVSRTRVFFFDIIYKLNFVHGCYSTKVLCLIQWIKKIKYTVIKFIHCFNSNFLGMFWEFFFQGWLLIMWEWKFKRPFRCLHVPPFITSYQVTALRVVAEYLHGIRDSIVSVLRSFGVVAAPVEVELRHFVCGVNQPSTRHHQSGSALNVHLNFWWKYTHVWIHCIKLHILKPSMLHVNLVYT